MQKRETLVEVVYKEGDELITEYVPRSGYRWYYLVSVKGARDGFTMHRAAGI